jgi:hypothetical protein
MAAGAESRPIRAFQFGPEGAAGLRQLLLPSRFSGHKPSFMKNLVILMVAALIVAVGYSDSKNPQACQKLGSDVAGDLTVIFTRTDATPSAQNMSPVAGTAASVAVVSPTTPPPVVAPASQAPAPRPLPAVAPDTTPAPALGDLVTAPGVFSYHAPKGWSITDTSLSTYKIATDVRKNDFAANINIVVQSFPNSLSEYVELNKQQIPSSTTLQNVKFSDQQPFTTASGLQGSAPDGSRHGKKYLHAAGVLLFSGTGEAKLVVVCTSLAGEGARMTPIFDASMKSFTVP